MSVDHRQTAVSVRAAGGDRDVGQALALRHRVFVTEQGIDASEDLDGHDAGALHLVATDPDGRVVGTCRLLAAAGQRLALGRMAVDPAWRRRGVAGALLREVDARARAGGARAIVLHAQTHARPLYAGAGYRPRGRPYLEAGVEHVTMVRELA